MGTSHDDAIFVVKPTHDVTAWVEHIDRDAQCVLPDGLGTLLLTHGVSGEGQALRAPQGNEKVSVRFNPEGVFAHPKGRQGKRKLKKLFQEYRVPTWERRRTPLIYFGDQLAAVAGLFVCEGFDGQDCELLWDKFHIVDA
ncbi:tRNA lysidine(34) synthetase TilS [Enterovibrio coralii]|uniref:tRNA lysidine(34) synthetase TilS n=1 Tax=Enterovibrio coralii TaxID=294935 RepID=UPI001E494B84|nr:tRNA lysidine(34) synthetase TilS [Enterovibrio coralii]